MSAIKKVVVNEELALVYDLKEKSNNTNLKAQEDRAVVAKIRADLVLPTDKILTVDIDFDTTSGYHGNTMMVMDDFGVDMLATAFEVKYGKAQADKIRKAWAEKEDHDDPRKPTYLLVQKPKDDKSMPVVFGKCGKVDHDPKDATNPII